jgi:hypothetical protein
MWKLKHTKPNFRNHKEYEKLQLLANSTVESACRWLQACFLLVSCDDPEDESDMFLVNFG